MNDVTHVSYEIHLPNATTLRIDESRYRDRGSLVISSEIGKIYVQRVLFSMRSDFNDHERRNSREL